MDAVAARAAATAAPAPTVELALVLSAPVVEPSVEAPEQSRPSSAHEPEISGS